MEIAIRQRDSGERSAKWASCGSEWTAGVRLCTPVVALPVGERQQLLGLGDKSRGKVAWIHVRVL